MSEEDSTPKLRPTRPNKPVRPSIAAFPPRIVEILGYGQVRSTKQQLAPIENIDGYIRDMKLTGEKEELYRKLYTPPQQPEVPKVESFQVPSDPLTVFTNLRVLKSGIVRVKITVPMEPVYFCQKKGKNAPLDVRVKAAKGFGYPDSVLEKMIRHHDATKNSAKKLDEFIDAIFGKSVNAKTSKVKAKTVHESLNTKFKKKPVKKYS